MKVGAFNVIRSHNMRKFFNSAMLNAGADSFLWNSKPEIAGHIHRSGDFPLFPDRKVQKKNN